MAVHIAEAADVHQNVEAELLAGAETAQHFVMASAMAEAGSNNFFTTGITGIFHRGAYLPVGIFTMLVKQSGRKLHL